MSQMEVYTEQAYYLGLALAIFIYGMDYTENSQTNQFAVAPEKYAYAGTAIGMTLSMLGSSYAIAMTSNAVFAALPKFYEYAANSNSTRYDVVRDPSYKYGYRMNKVTVDIRDIENGGYYIVGMAIIFFLLGSIIAVAGYLEISRLQTLEDSTKIMTYEMGYKYLTLGTVIGIGSWTSGLAIGDAAWEYISWFGGYFGYAMDLSDYWNTYVRLDAEWDVASELRRRQIEQDLRSMFRENGWKWKNASWKQICKRQDDGGYCIEFWPPQEAWERDLLFHSISFGVTILILVVFSVAQYGVAYDWLTHQHYGIKAE